MDVTTVPISIHPQATDYLFKHYRVVSRIFLEVLGHLELEHMAIALLNKKGELIFLSRRPSVEWNLIEKNLWIHDASYQWDFILRNKACLWEELFHNEHFDVLKYYKLENPGFSMGISIPSMFEDYYVVYTFALKSTREIDKSNFINNIDKLEKMGRYCFQKICRAIPLPDCLNPYIVQKPKLKLIINKVNYERST